MEEWKEYRLDAICRLSAGGDAPHNAVKKPTADMTVPIYSNGENEKGLYGYTDSHKIEAPAVTISARGNIGYVCYRKENFVPIVRLITAKANEQILSNEFLYYCLCNTHIWGDGSVQKQLTVPMISEYIVRIPPLNIQSKIVHVLKSLDDKIEENRRINDNLEQQAQALFKSWFVDFEPFRDQPFVESELGMIPEGWRVGTLFDVADIFDKQRKPLSGKEREGMKRLYPYYGATSCMDYVDNYLFDGVYTLIGEDGSVSKEDGFPYMQYVWGKFWVNNHAHILQGKNGFSTEMIYVFLSITNIQHLVTGAVQAKLSQANMQKIVLAIPPMNVLNQVRPAIDSMYETRRERENESRRLAELRDTLLPRLMSGEIKVGDVML